MQKIIWGIIGCGNVTELKSGPAFKLVEGSSIQTVMRRNEAMVKDYANRHQIPEYYTDADKIIHHPLINSIYVATPPSTHAAYAIAAMKAGKAVYVEKPMAANYAECLEMIRVSEETGQPLYVAYYRRTLDAFLKVKSWIDAGVIGDVISVNLQLMKAFGIRDQFPEKQSWHVHPEIAGAGHFYDLASHQLDYLDFLLGPITKVQGQATNQAGYYSAEDTVSATFEFKNGVKGVGNWCFVVNLSDEKDEIEIIGTRGSIRFATFDKRDVELQIGDNIEYYPVINHSNISFPLVKQVVEALQGKAECISTMYSAARTNFVMEEIVKSFYHR